MGTRILWKARLTLLFATPLISLLCASGAESVTLFSGHDLTGWRNPTGAWQSASSVVLDGKNAKIFAITPGTGVLVNGPAGKTSNLLTELEHGDCEAHIEFCVPKDSNSGVYFMGRYEVQILDSFGKKDVKYGDCGGVYASCSGGEEYKGKPPSQNVSKAPGEWQSFDVTFRAPRFDSAGKKTANAKFVKIVHNGVVIHENVEVPRPTCAAHSLDEKPKGPIMLQGDHGPVAYRNVRVKLLNAD